MSALLRNKVIALWNKAGTEEEQARPSPRPSHVFLTLTPPFPARNAT